jgi:predicted ester cyclase
MKERYVAMSLPENKALVQRSTATFNARDWDAHFALFAEDYRPGRDALRRGIEALLAAFPDLTFAHEDELAEGDTVALRETGEGTHTGPFLGIAPTGRRVRFRQLGMLRVRHGQLVEGWGMRDRLSLLRQLGALPGSVAGAPAAEPAGEAEAGPRRPVRVTAEPASVEQNKALIRRSTDDFNARAWTTYYARIAADYVVHGMPPGTPQGPDGIRQSQQALLTAFPDLQFTHDAELAEDDRVVVRETATATHQGPFLGIAPTGTRVHWSMASINRIRDGTFTEAWVVADTLGLLEQLGAVPAFPPA